MRLLAVTLLLAVAALAGWWWWWWWPAASPAPVAPAPRSDGSARAVPAVAASLAGTERAEAVPVADAPSAPPIPASATWIDVRVVDAATKALVAGADVWWKDATCDARVAALPDAEREAFYGDWYDELVARSAGWSARTDDRGVARVHAHVRGTLVFARHHDRFGVVRATLEHARAGVVLEIERDFAVTVVVVDCDGRPAAGVPVCVEVAATHQSTTLSSDAAGIARFKHLQHVMVIDAAGSRIATEAKASLRVPGLEACASTFPLPPPAEPVTLVLPPTGALHVHVVHPGRKLETTGAAVWIGAADACWDTTYQAKDQDADGVIRFPFLPMASAFEVRVDIGNLALQQSVAGPASPGQVVHATFEVPVDAIALTGRVLGADGRPLALTTLTAAYHLPWSSGCSELPTDANGVFVWHMGAPRSEDTSRELSGFVVWLERGPLDRVHAEIASRELRAGVNDLGDIQLDTLPFVVAGRFRFDRPATRDRVEFGIERWLEPDAAGEGGRWHREPYLDEQQDDEGRFVVRGTPGPGRLRLHCGAHAEPVEFARGATDVVVDFVHGHSLSVECVVPGGLPWDEWCELSVVRDGDATPLVVAGENPFRFRPLPAGTYSVRVGLKGLPDVITTRAGIVLPGPDGEFDRSVDIDLHDVAAALRLRVAAHGAEIEDGEVSAFVGQTVESGLRYGHGVRDGEVVMLVPQRPVDVLVMGRRFQPLHMRGVQGTVDCDLRPRLAASVPVRGLPALAEDQAVIVTIACSDSAGAAARGSVRRRHEWIDVGSLLDTDTQQRVAEQGAGIELRAIDVDRTLTAHVHAGEQSRELRSLSPRTIPAGTLPAALTFDAAEIRAALAEMQR